MWTSPLIWFDWQVCYNLLWVYRHVPCHFADRYAWELFFAPVRTYRYNMEHHHVYDCRQTFVPIGNVLHRVLNGYQVSGFPDHFREIWNYNLSLRQKLQLSKYFAFTCTMVLLTAIGVMINTKRMQWRVRALCSSWTVKNRQMLSPGSSSK